ncbi:MAG: 4Fe-4S binding protein, partial [Candidatus Ranarchaeia archaeon]
MTETLTSSPVKKALLIGDTQIWSLRDLVVKLEKLEEKGFAKFRKRMHTWIKKVVKDNRLAREVKNLHYPENVIKTINSRIQFLEAVDQGLEEAEIHVDLPLYILPLRLSWDKNICVGCDICAAICPKEAIEVEDSKVTIDSDKCVLCGLC